MTFQGIRALLSTYLLLIILLLINVKADYQGEPHDPNKFLPQPTNDINSLNILSSSRNLQETLTEDCFQPQCQYVNALDQSSINYNINIGSSAELNFEFATGQNAQQLTLSLYTGGSAVTQTSINISPADPGTTGHLGTIVGMSWSRGLMLDSTDNPNRTLSIQVLAFSNNANSTISFTIVSSYNPPQNTVVWTSNSGNDVWEVIVALVGGTIVLAFIIFCIHSIYSRRRITRARIRQMDRQAQFELALPDPAEEARNLTEEKIDQRFPEAPFYTFQSSFPQKICSICLEELKTEQVCRQLYCEHIFHSECIQLWLANQLKKKFAFCPNCNMNMMVEPDIQHAPHIHDLNHDIMHEQEGYHIHQGGNDMMQGQQGYHHIHPAGSGNEI